MIRIGERQVLTCEQTGKPVVMEYTGNREDSGNNGHPGWLCLHEDTEEEDAIAVAKVRKGGEK